MPISLDIFEHEEYRRVAGITDTNETIFKINPGYAYVVDCINTAAGSASLKVEAGNAQPTDFSMMSTAFDGTQSVNFSRRVEGCTYVGLDVASGTWTIRVRRV